MNYQQQGYTAQPQQQQMYAGQYQSGYQNFQGAGYYQQQPIMQNPVMQQQQYPQDQMYVQAVYVQSNVPQGYPAMQQEIQPLYKNNLPNNANNCEFSCRIRCPSCSKECNTMVEQRAGGATYGWVAVTCLCCFPCCFIPFFIDQCKDKIHKCPYCQSEVGVCTKSMC